MNQFFYNIVTTNWSWALKHISFNTETFTIPTRHSEGTQRILLADEKHTIIWATVYRASSDREGQLLEKDLSFFQPIEYTLYFFYSLPAEICSPRPSERSSSLVFVPKCPQLLGCQQKRQGSNPDPRGYTQPRPQLKELVKQPEYIFWSIVRWFYSVKNHLNEWFKNKLIDSF